jgi:hypothetical protein
MTALVLPQMCPVPSCGTWLQRPLNFSDYGVRPHYLVCHPGLPIPLTLEEAVTG